MVEDQVMEEAEGATEAVGLVMATREVDSEAAATEVTEVMMEVSKLTYSRFLHSNEIMDLISGIEWPKTDSYCFRLRRRWKLQ